MCILVCSVHMYVVDSRESTAYGASEGGEKISSYELVLSCA